MNKKGIELNEQYIKKFKEIKNRISEEDLCSLHKLYSPKQQHKQIGFLVEEELMKRINTLSNNGLRHIIRFARKEKNKKLAFNTFLDKKVNINEALELFKPIYQYHKRKQEGLI